MHRRENHPFLAFCERSREQCRRSRSQNGGVDGQTQDLFWDYDGHLEKVDSGTDVTEFLYDADGIRVAKWDGEKYTVYVGSDYEVSSGPNMLAEPGFETSAGWNDVPSSVFPGTSIWRVGWGSATEHGGAYGFSVTNHAYGRLLSDSIPVTPDAQYDFHAYVQGEVDAYDSVSGWLIRAYWYRADGSSISYTNAQYSGAVPGSWTQKGGRVTAPSDAATVKLSLWMYGATGWVAYDDVSFVKAGTSTNLAPNPGFESGKTGWTEIRDEPGNATSFYRTSSSYARRSGYGWVLSNLAYGRIQSDSVPIVGGASYDLHAWVRGELDEVGTVGLHLIRAAFYDSSGGYISYQNAYSGAEISTTYTRRGGTVTAPSNAATVLIQLWSYNTSGWVAFDDVTLVKSGTSTNLAPNPGFETANSGWTEIPSTAFPATSIWRSTWGMATERTGQYGYAISNVGYGYKWTDPISVTPGDELDVFAWMRGEIDPDDSAGSAGVRAYFYDSSGAYVTWAGEMNSPGSLNGAWELSGKSVTVPAGAATVRMMLISYSNSGWAAFDDAYLSDVSTNTSTTYYSVGGRRVAFRDSDGIQYLFSDHVGSASVSYRPSDGQTERQYYMPYGGIRHTDGLDTDIGYTGQRADTSTGLMFYNARYYDPAIGRFISPDTIVPDPANPQDYDRYAYVRNNPVNHNDPTGHETCGWRGSSDGVSYVCWNDFEQYVEFVKTGKRWEGNAAVDGFPEREPSEERDPGYLYGDVTLCLPNMLCVGIYAQDSVDGFRLDEDAGLTFAYGGWPGLSVDVGRRSHDTSEVETPKNANEFGGSDLAFSWVGEFTLPKVLVGSFVEFTQSADGGWVRTQGVSVGSPGVQVGPSWSLPFKNVPVVQSLLRVD